jgi:3-phosphoshikimate 1-carboxyvinyltransferase
MARVYPPVLALPRAASAVGSVRLPGSKSLSIRACCCRGARPRHHPHRRPARLGRHPRDAGRRWRPLGVAVRVDGERCEVDGVAGRFADGAARALRRQLGADDPHAWCRRSRRRSPVAGSTPRPGSAGVVLDGVPRMRERPIGDLVDGLRRSGADIAYLGSKASRRSRCVPAPIAGGPRAGARRHLQPVRHRGAAGPRPCWRRTHPVRIDVEGDLVSRPYVDMTVALMARFGVPVERDGDAAFVVPAAAAYRAPATPVRIEGDASAASYFPRRRRDRRGPVRVLGAGLDSLQGDVRFADALEAMGARVRRGARLDRGLARRAARRRPRLRRDPPTRR